MAKKLISFIIILFLVGCAYVIMAFTMPATNEIITSANASLAASANMSNLPGTQEMVQTAPIWLWFIPGLVGVVFMVGVLVKKD